MKLLTQNITFGSQARTKLEMRVKSREHFRRFATVLQLPSGNSVDIPTGKKIIPFRTMLRSFSKYCSKTLHFCPQIFRPL